MMSRSINVGAVPVEGFPPIYTGDIVRIYGENYWAQRIEITWFEDGRFMWRVYDGAKGIWSPLLDGDEPPSWVCHHGEL